MMYMDKMELLHHQQIKRNDGVQVVGLQFGMQEIVVLELELLHIRKLKVTHSMMVFYQVLTLNK